MTDKQLTSAKSQTATRDGDPMQIPQNQKETFDSAPVMKSVSSNSMGQQMSSRMSSSQQQPYHQHVPRKTFKGSLSDDASKSSSDRRPIANALFIQNLNPLKQKKKEEDAKQQEQFIATMGAQVAIVERSIEAEKQSIVSGSKEGDSVENSTKGRNSIESNSQNQLRSSQSKLPRAGFINIIKDGQDDLLEYGGAEPMKIHPVKHLPKSDEEILDNLIKENVQVKASKGKANRDAKSKLAQRKALALAREQKLQQADDVSEVETVIPSNTLFSVDINLDNLKDHLGQIRTHLSRQDQLLEKLTTQVNHRSTEKGMGMYLKRIAKSIPQTLGTRPHAFKLNDPGFFHEDFETEHGHLLKEGVEKVIEKLEILSSVTLKNHRYKTKCESRLKKLEEAELLNLKKEQYAADIERTETRINQTVREHLSKFQEDQLNNQKKLDQQIMKFDKKINDYRSEVLWRIKDCEELLKGRVKTQELNDQIKSLESRINDKIEFDNETLHGRLMKVLETCQNRIKTAELFSKDKYMQSEAYIKLVDQKVGSMATIAMIDKIYESQKNLKSSFVNEFSSFQEYLKEQNNRFSKQDLRLRDIERKLKEFNDIGGVEELSKFIKEVQDERSSYGIQSKANLGNATGNQSQRFDSTNQVHQLEQTALTGGSGGGTGLQSAHGGGMPGMMSMESRAIKYIQETLAEHKSQLDRLADTLLEKVDTGTMESLLASKISNQEINELLPDMKMYQNKFTSQIEEAIQDLIMKMEEKFIQQDQRMNKIRHEFDMATLNKFISSKADQVTMMTSFQMQDVRIATIDKNLVAIATDFETFQLAINRMHGVMIELQEASKEVMLGKRNLNCLSCGTKEGQTVTGAKAPPSYQQIWGKDGRVYRGIDENSNISLEYTTQDNQTSRVDHSQRRMDRVTSAQPKLMGRTSSSQEQLERMKIKVVSGKKNSNLIHPPYGISDQVSRHLLNSRQSHKNRTTSQQQIETTKSGVDITSNAIILPDPQASKSQIGFYSGHQRKKLPIGFLIQNEKRELHKTNPGMQGDPKTRPDSASAKIKQNYVSDVNLSNDMSI